MALIEWKEQFKTGVASVDHEHETMIGLLNDLHAKLEAGADKETVALFLGEVYAKISAHFALEEREMQERGYDQFTEHKADHEELLDEIRDIMDRHEADPSFDFETRLAQELRDWFGLHFQTKDARLHKMLG